MKKILIRIIVICIFSGLMFSDNNLQKVYGNTEEYAITTKKTHIKVKVLSATKKQIKLKFTNSGNKDFYFSENFILQKRVNNKWKKVEFKKGVKFRMSMIAWKKSDTIIKLKWKKFFGKNLSKGKYRIKFVRTKTFKIK